MSDLLLPVLTVAVPPGSDAPGRVLKDVASQIAALTEGALQGEVWSRQLHGFLATYDLNAIIAPGGPGHGLLQVDHLITEPYPAYVTAPCFGEVWPPPPLGPSDPSYRIAPAAKTARELVALINQVLASPQARDTLGFLLQQCKGLPDSAAAGRNGSSPQMAESSEVDAAST